MTAASPTSVSRRRDAKGDGAPVALPPGDLVASLDGEGEVLAGLGVAPGGPRLRAADVVEVDELERVVVALGEGQRSTGVHVRLGQATLVHRAVPLDEQRQGASDAAVVAGRDVVEQLAEVRSLRHQRSHGLEVEEHVGGGQLECFALRTGGEDARRLERPLGVVLRRVEGEARARHVGGAGERGGDRRRIVDRRGSPAVGGDRLGVIAVGPEHGLDRLRRALVQPRPAQRGEIVEHRLAHERVAEAEVADAARHDDARHDRRIEVVEAAVGGESGGVGEEAHVDLGSDHRADGQHVERAVGEPCQASAHHVADGLRYRLRPAGIGVGPALAGEERGQLGHEEGVAARAPVHPGRGGGGGELAGDARHHRGHVVGVEAGEREAPDVGHPGDRSQGSRQRSGIAEIGWAVAARHHRAGDGELGDHVGQQLERRVVGPVEVVDHDQHRYLGADLAHHPCDLIGEVEGRGRRAALARRRVGADQRGDERSLGEGGFCDLGVRRTALVDEQRAHRFHPRPQRRRHRTFDALSVGDDETGPAGTSCQLVEQGRLADARLALDEQHPGRALRGPAQHLVDDRQLAVTTEQRRRRRVGIRIGIGTRRRRRPASARSHPPSRVWWRAPAAGHVPARRAIDRG